MLCHYYLLGSAGGGACHLYVDETQAWNGFCQNLSHEYHVELSQDAQDLLNAQAWTTLMLVNECVNSSLLAVMDQHHSSVLNQWGYSDDEIGDCEDIQPPEPCGVVAPKDRTDHPG